MALPFADPTIYDLLEVREGDVFVCCAPKSGTTWSCFISQQLVSGGDMNYEYLFHHSPWLEFVKYPGQSMEERLKRLADMPRVTRRIFKAHVPIPALLNKPGAKVIVCVRNPLDTLASWFHFARDGISAELAKMWNFPTPSTNEEALVAALKDDGYWYMVNAWWPFRHHPNVLMVHYNELKNDRSAAIDKFAKFLGVPVSSELKQTILDRTSFSYMKEHELKFEGGLAGKEPHEFQCLAHGSMIRKGRIGGGAELSAEAKEKYNEHCKQLSLNQEQLSWCENGGPLPSAEDGNCYRHAASM